MITLPIIPVNAVPDWPQYIYRSVSEQEAKATSVEPPDANIVRRQLCGLLSSKINGVIYTAPIVSGEPYYPLHGVMLLCGIAALQKVFEDINK